MVNSGRIILFNGYVFSALVLLFCIGHIFYAIGKRVLTSYWLQHDTVRVNAVIIDEKNYAGNSPVSHQGSYSYLFYVNGEAYTNNSHDSKLQVGDSIAIEYAVGRPYFNRPATGDVLSASDRNERSLH